MIKKIKNWLASIVTILIVIALFCIIFVETKLAQPSPTFFMELGLVLGLMLMMKIFWYDYAEDKRLEEDDIKSEKTNYFAILDNTVEDSNELDEFLKILNKENKEHYVATKIGSRNAKNMAIKTKWLCFWRPSYRKKSEEEIGIIRYNKLYFKCLRKADKLRPIKSEELMALSDSGEVLYDSKNHLKEKKRAYQIITTLFSFTFATALACMGIKEILMNWTNVFRYVLYLASMVFTIATTIFSAYRRTGIETLDYFSRLKFIIDKYATYKEKEGKKDNGNISRTSDRLC